jgi:hypothetical protein
MPCAHCPTRLIEGCDVEFCTSDCECPECLADVEADRIERQREDAARMLANQVAPADHVRRELAAAGVRWLR